MPLKNFSDLLWAIDQVLKVKHGRVHKSYINKNVFRDTVEYAQMVFGQCIRDDTIDKKYKNLELLKTIQ